MPSRNDAKKSILVDGKAVIPEISQQEIRVFPNQAGSITVEQDSDELPHGYMFVIVARQNVERLVEFLRKAEKELAEIDGDIASFNEG